MRVSGCWWEVKQNDDRRYMSTGREKGNTMVPGLGWSGHLHAYIRTEWIRHITGYGYGGHADGGSPIPGASFLGSAFRAQELHNSWVCGMI